MPLSRPLTCSRGGGSSTPALRAASYAVSGKMSQPPKTRLSSFSSGTNSRISGERRSVRLPRRMVASWVTEPIGSAHPVRTNSTPAINVVLTAPMPGMSTPSFPFGGAMLVGRRIGFPPLHAMTRGGSPPPDHADKFLDLGVCGQNGVSTHVTMIKPECHHHETTIRANEDRVAIM